MVRAFPLEDGAALVHLHNVSGGLLGGDRSASRCGSAEARGAGNNHGRNPPLPPARGGSGTHSDFVKNDGEVQHFIHDDLEVIRTQRPKFIPQEVITNAQGQIRLLLMINIPYTASGIRYSLYFGSSC